MPTDDEISWKQQQANTLLQILELGQKDIAAGNFRDVAEFFAELDRDDEKD